MQHMRGSLRSLVARRDRALLRLAERSLASLSR